jgi:MFS family permease
MVPLTFLVTYANQDLSFTYAAATRLVVVTGASAIAGKIILGYISDKVQRKHILVLCGLLITAGCSGIAWLTGPAFYLSVALFGIGYGAVWALYAACASDYFARELSGIIVGLWTVFLGVGLTLSPIIAGWLADLTGALTWSFIAAGIGGLVSILFLIPLGKPRLSDSD